MRRSDRVRRILREWASEAPPTKRRAEIDGGGIIVLLVLALAAVLICGACLGVLALRAVMAAHAG